MNVLLSGDTHVYNGLELVIYTLLTHNKNVNIFVFTMDIIVHNHDKTDTCYHALDDIQKNKLRKIVKYLDGNGSNICFINTAEYYHNYLEKSVNRETVFTPFAALRLLVDLILPELDDILYLDADTAIQSNIEDMYYSYLHKDEDKYYYASYAYPAFGYLGEMVSGILLMNLAKMRKFNFLEKARKLYNKNLYKYPDQMALRDTAEAGRLPETYGYIDELERCNYTPAILHFTNKLTPKIYNLRDDGANNIECFYKRYPCLKYVQEGCQLLDTFNI